MKLVIYYGCRGETAKRRLDHFFSVRSVLRESLRYTRKKKEKKDGVIFLARNLFPVQSGACTTGEFLRSNALHCLRKGCFLNTFFRKRHSLSSQMFFPGCASLSIRNQQKRPFGSIIHTPSSALKRYPPSDFQWYRSIILRKR